MFFATSDVNWMSVKVSFQHWDLPLRINVSLNGWVKKNYVEKCVLKLFLTDDEYQFEIFNFADLCRGLSIV